MKTNLKCIISVVLAVLACLSADIASMNAQATFNPNAISGTIRFSNAVPNLFGPGPALTITAYPGGAGKLFNGLLDEVTLWSIALTDSEVAALMTATPQGGEPGLQGYWRFDEASGGTAFDWTGHGYNAVLGSGVSWTTSTAPIFR
jgi:hypothetical protein